jgi:hypothetical protein
MKVSRFQEKGFLALGRLIVVESTVAVWLDVFFP